MEGIMKRIRSLALLLAGIVLVLSFGCRKEETSLAPNTCPGGPATGYGSGHFSFILSEAGDTIDVSGPYKPSSLFGNDSASMGAGGFHIDTLVGANTINCELMAYSHIHDATGLNEHVIVFTLSNPGGTLSVGNYQLVSARSNPPGMIARAHYHFFSDFLGNYFVLEARSGVLNIASYDSCTGHVTGTVTGILQGFLPDTTTQARLTQGTFDLTLVHRYFPF